MSKEIPEKIVAIPPANKKTVKKHTYILCMLLSINIFNSIPMVRAALLTVSASILGMLDIRPQSTLPTVLVIPIHEINCTAVSAGIPPDSARSK